MALIDLLDVAGHVAVRHIGIYIVEEVAVVVRPLSGGEENGADLIGIFAVKSAVSDYRAFDEGLFAAVIIERAEGRLGTPSDLPVVWP